MSENPMLVIKVGGGKAIDRDAVVGDLVELAREGQRMVVIHGGAETTNEVAVALGHPPQFLTSESGIESRRTDRRTLEIFEMVYCGLLNKSWVEKLQQRGVNAIGLSGLDGRLFEGRRKDRLRARIGDKRVVIRDDWTGTVERINTELLLTLIDQGYLPVLTPPGISDQGEAINVDGDRAAAVVASSLSAEILVILSDVPGLLADFPDPASLVPQIPAARARDYLDLAAGRMKKKIMGAAEAVATGVGRVILADGRTEQPIKKALAGAGTHIGEPPIKT